MTAGLEGIARSDKIAVRVQRRQRSPSAQQEFIFFAMYKSRPNVGGVVGLADLYVDRALGFSLGWAAWVCLLLFNVVHAGSCLFQYNWSVTIRKCQ